MFHRIQKILGAQGRKRMFAMNLVNLPFRSRDLMMEGASIGLVVVRNAWSYCLASFGSKYSKYRSSIDSGMFAGR